MFEVGQRVPDAQLGQLAGGELRRVDLVRLTFGQRTIALGVPGAFTPACTRQYVPDFLANADLLRASGFARILCICPNDPWTVEAWARQVDPEGRLDFLSDGNLHLARGLGATVHEPEFFMGERNRRYLMVVKDGVVERLVLESGPMTLNAAPADDFIEI